MDPFTMVFIDLDDTLIPSRLRNNIRSNLGIDIFETLSSTLLKKLQYTVIKSIDAITKVLIRQNKPIFIAIVSNAKSKWIKALLKGTPDGNPPKLPILAKYLFSHNIALHSAIEEMYNFLHAKYNKATADLILSHAKTEQKDTRWMWKYITFSGILLQYKQQQQKQCNRIVSFGDGTHEATALLEYSTEFDIPCDHIQFINSPTVCQLQQQWKHIADSVEDIVSPKRSDRSLVVYDMNKVFGCDNNRYCTGLTDQIWAIGTYFELWMNDLDEDYDEPYVTNRLQEVCVRVQKRMVTMKKAQHLKSIVLHLRENKQFDTIFIRQIVKKAMGGRDDMK